MAEPVAFAVGTPAVGIAVAIAGIALVQQELIHGLHHLPS